LIVFGFLVVWPAFAWSVLRSPRVQTFLAQHIAAYMGRELETRVEVGGVNVSFFLNVVLEDVSLWDRQGERMVHARRMVFDIGKFSPRNRLLSVNKLHLDEALLALTTYEGEDQLNVQFLLDYFSSDKERRPSERSWDVVCKSFELVDSDFLMLDQNRRGEKPAFDPHDFELYSLDLLMTDILLDQETLSFSLEHLKFLEANGFGLRHFSGFLSVGPQSTRIQDMMLRSDKSMISTDLELIYNGYEAFGNFYEDVAVYLNINNSRLDLADLGYFMPALYGMEGPVTIRGLLSGRPADIRGRDFYLSFGGHTAFRGNFHLAGLPDVENTHVNFLVEEFRTNMDDITGFRLPHTSRSSHIQVPDNLFRLGELSFRGRFAGYPTDLSANGTFQTDLGELTTNIEVQREPGSLHPAYKGNLNTPGFELGLFFGVPELLGSISLNAEVEGEGISLETIDLHISGKVDAFELSGYAYENLEVSGLLSNRRFNGSLLVDDSNLSLDFQGLVSFEEELPAFDFRAKIDRANLTRLNIYQRDPEAESVVSARLAMNARAASLPDLHGQLEVMDLTYEEHSLPGAGETFSRTYTTETLRFSNAILSDRRQKLILESDFLDAELTGRLTIDQLRPSVERFLANFIPAYLPDAAASEVLEVILPLQDFSLKVLIKDTDVLSELFLPWLGFSKGSRLALDFNSASKELNFSGTADELRLAGSRFAGWKMETARSGNAFLLNMSSRRLLFSDSLFVEHINLHGTLALNAFLVDTRWDSGASDRQNHGHLAMQANFPEKRHAVLRVLQSYAMVNESLWEVNSDNEIVIDSARVEVNNLMVHNNRQFVMADGVFSPDPDDRMTIAFREFDFSNLAMFIRARNMDFEGVVNGSMDVTALFQTPGIEAEITIKDFAFNREHLGDFTIFTVWDHEQEGFMLAAELAEKRKDMPFSPLVVSGYIYPDRRSENFDLDLLVTDFTLSVWSRYLDNFAPGFHGLASGHLRLEGPFSNPELSGAISGRDAGFRVDYLNTRYYFSHNVEIGKDFFRFSDLVLVDEQGNTGLASGTIRHQLFRDFELDLTIRPERMLVLNTSATQNELYYGRAFASGLIHIYGPEDNITMDISARTNRGTQVFLPLTYSGEVRETNFITFISRDIPIATQSFPEPRIAGITLNFDLEVTPEAEVQLIFDSQIGDIIRGRGTADLKLEINSLGAFNMYGEYHIEEGDYLFTLQNLINKRFRIEQGGLISWTGDPNDADVDLRATYRLRTTLYDLVMDVDTSDVYRRRMPVDCVLILEDKLFNPTITFDIFLPGSDEGTREMVERLITTEQEMNRQVFSLLILNRFLPTTPDQYNTALGYGVGSTSSELLSNQLSNWLSQISSDFDVGVNYRPGDEISSQELEVALSTQLFDDRVIIDGNVGVAGTHPTGNQRVSNIIGDVNIEVKITPEGKFRIKAFNRSNTFDMLNANSPYTQGVGLFYRREFDRLGELFRQQSRPEYPERESPEETRAN
jgi:hypothetical protein